MHDAAKSARILQTKNIPARTGSNPTLTKMLVPSRPVRSSDQMAAARPRTSAQSQASPGMPWTVGEISSRAKIYPECP